MNIIVETNDEMTKNQLISEGYELIEDIKNDEETAEDETVQEEDKKSETEEEKTDNKKSGKKK